MYLPSRGPMLTTNYCHDTPLLVRVCMNRSRKQVPWIETRTIGIGRSTVRCELASGVLRFCDEQNYSTPDLGTARYHCDSRANLPVLKSPHACPFYVFEDESISYPFDRFKTH